MSGPFSPLSPQGQPAWGTITSTNGNFSAIQIGGGTSIPEVGYGEGGYGEDGYDTPSVNIPASAQPIWTVETSR